MSDQKSLRCVPNGPYLIQGPLLLVDSKGRDLPVPEGRNVALCRCGLSASKPFCDGTHTKCDFEASDGATAPWEQAAAVEASS